MSEPDTSSDNTGKLVVYRGDRFDGWRARCGAAQALAAEGREVGDE
jgi:hypothetical protein